jgi:glutamine synthetase
MRISDPGTAPVSSVGWQYRPPELADVLGSYFVSSFLAHKRNEIERYVTNWEFREYAYHL